ncbi:hypothetical protein GUI12_03675 [Anaplasmataceae bacterium AB001_6]|nr:hypothetical protein GUI12_03675 [Anaplasmataceae bacterium AB001_6]
MSYHLSLLLITFFIPLCIKRLDSHIFIRGMQLLLVIFNLIIAYQYLEHNFSPHYFLITTSFQLLLMSFKDRKLFNRFFFIFFIVIAFIIILNYDLRSNITLSYSDIFSFQSFILKNGSYYASFFGFIMLILAILLLNSSDDSVHYRFMFYSSIVISLVNSITWANFIVHYEIAVTVSIMIMWKSIYNNSDAYHAGLRYAALHFFAGFLMLVASSGIIDNIHSPFLQFDLNEIKAFYRYCFFVAFLINVASFPFSAWVPDAYSSVHISDSCILQCYMTKVSLLFLALFFPGKESLVILGFITLIYAIIMLLMNSNLLRILCYFIVGHIALIMILIGEGAVEAGGVSIVDYIFVSLANQLLFAICVYAAFLSTRSLCITSLGNNNIVLKEAILFFLIIAAMSIFAFPFTRAYMVKSNLLYSIHGGLVYRCFISGNIILSSFSIIRVIYSFMRVNKVNNIKCDYFDNEEFVVDKGKIMILLFAASLIFGVLFSYDSTNNQGILLYLWGSQNNIWYLFISFLICFVLRKVLFNAQKINKYDIDFLYRVILYRSIEFVYNSIAHFFRSMISFVKYWRHPINNFRHNMSDFISDNVIEFTIVSSMLFITIFSLVFAIHMALYSA